MKAVKRLLDEVLMLRINGVLLMLAAACHILLGVIVAINPLRAIYSYGVWNALTQHSQAWCMQSVTCLQMNSLWWFISFGLLLLVL